MKKLIETFATIFAILVLIGNLNNNSDNKEKEEVKRYDHIVAEMHYDRDSKQYYFTNVRYDGVLLIDTLQYDTAGMQNVLMTWSDNANTVDIDSYCGATVPICENISYTWENY